MSLITNNISGSSSNNSIIGVTGSIIFSNNSLNFPNFPDSNTKFFVSGSVSDSLNKSVFGGDVIISGSTKILSGLSGSLTNLPDGTSYLIAGSNVTIATGSNGAITINSIGGVIPGSNNQLLTSNGTGSAVAETNLIFNDVTTTLEITGSLANGTSTNKATGLYSHVEGNDSTASGDYSHAEGWATIASGRYSHAEGWANTVSGRYSHAEGVTSIASGWYAHAEGDTCIAAGDASHAEGVASETILTAYGAHASGYNLIASGSNIGQNVVGKYNKRDNNFSLFVVGNGTGISNAARSDILRVNNSDVQISGSLIISGSLAGSTSTLVNTDTVIQSALLYLANNT